MPPQEFYIRVQEGESYADDPIENSRKLTMHECAYAYPGIAGGFAPPTPNAITTLVRSASSRSPNSFEVTSAKRQDGTPNLIDSFAPKELPVDDHKALLDELQGILKVS